MNKILIMLLVIAGLLQGCLATKVVTVPMRVGGAVASVVPIVGDAVEETVDIVADTIDKVPL